MKSFKEYITEAAVGGKNVHMTHLEDAVLYGGVSGARAAIFALRSLRDMLGGNANSPVDISVKWDGCLSGDTRIVIEGGQTISLEEYIDLYEYATVKPKVYARDMELKSDVYTDVIAASASFGDKPWVEVQLENGSSLKLTDDHEVYTANRGWVKAKDLCVNDDIYQEK